MTALRARLDPWLGKPSWKQSAGRVTFYYRFDSEIPPITRNPLKVEICTREHFSVLGLIHRELVVENAWFSGIASIVTYRLEELLAPKLRALYQRKRGPDLFDLALALERAPDLNLEAIAEGFRRYLANEGLKVTRTEFERNLDEKLADPRFGRDVEALLSTGRLAGSFDPAAAARAVKEALLAKT
jgi:predicted nucleotidyltransferase component of viral defense system